MTTVIFLSVNWTDNKNEFLSHNNMCVCVWVHVQSKLTKASFIKLKTGEAYSVTADMATQFHKIHDLKYFLVFTHISTFFKN